MSNKISESESESLVKRVYSECSPLLQSIKVINTLKHDENDTILRKITEKSHSYNGFAFNVTRCFLKTSQLIICCILRFIIWSHI